MSFVFYTRFFSSFSPSSLLRRLTPGWFEWIPFAFGVACFGPMRQPAWGTEVEEHEKTVLSFFPGSPGEGQPSGPSCASGVHILYQSPFLESSMWVLISAFSSSPQALMGQMTFSTSDTQVTFFVYLMQEMELGSCDCSKDLSWGYPGSLCPCNKAAGQIETRSREIKVI